MTLILPFCYNLRTSRRLLTWRYETYYMRLRDILYEVMRHTIWGYETDYMRLRDILYEVTRHTIWGYETDYMRLRDRLYEVTRHTIWGYETNWMSLGTKLHEVVRIVYEVSSRTVYRLRDEPHEVEWRTCWSVALYLIAVLCSTHPGCWRQCSTLPHHSAVQHSPWVLKAV